MTTKGLKTKALKILNNLRKLQNACNDLIEEIDNSNLNDPNSQELKQTLDDLANFDLEDSINF